MSDAESKDTRTQPPMPRRGVSQGFEATDTGVKIRLNGVLPGTSAQARAAAKVLCDRVQATFPSTRCLCQWMPPVPDEGSTLVIIVHVDHDEMAVFKFGPMHRREIARVRAFAIANASSSWWEHDSEGEVADVS